MFLFHKPTRQLFPVFIYEVEREDDTIPVHFYLIGGTHSHGHLLQKCNILSPTDILEPVRPNRVKYMHPLWNDVKESVFPSDDSPFVHYTHFRWINLAEHNHFHLHVVTSNKEGLSLLEED